MSIIFFEPPSNVFPSNWAQHGHNIPVATLGDDGITLFSSVMLKVSTVWTRFRGQEGALGQTPSTRNPCVKAKDPLQRPLSDLCSVLTNSAASGKEGVGGRELGAIWTQYRWSSSETLRVLTPATPPTPSKASGNTRGPWAAATAWPYWPASDHLTELPQVAVNTNDCSKYKVVMEMLINSYVKAEPEIHHARIS